jgi:hypothetical protein
LVWRQPTHTRGFQTMLLTGISFDFGHQLWMRVEFAFISQFSCWCDALHEAQKWHQLWSQRWYPVRSRGKCFNDRG